MSNLTARRRLAMLCLLKGPQTSDAAIAKACDVSPQSVLNWRHDFEALDLIPTRETTKRKPPGNQYTKR